VRSKEQRRADDLAFLRFIVVVVAITMAFGVVLRLL